MNYLIYLLQAPPINCAYIDPGTGSMLFTILIGAISVVAYGLRGLIIKLRYSLSKNVKKNERTIPIVIFSDDKRYWNTFRPICEELDFRGQKAVYLTQSKDDPAFQQNFKNVDVEYIGDGNKGFARLNMLDADIVLSTTPSLDVYQWKRSRNVRHYTHILHAANDVTCYRMFGIDYYDSIILSGAFQVKQIRELERIRNLKEKELVVLGLPYLDAMKKRMEDVKTEKHSRTVLLAPSWGENGILNKYGSRIIDELINTGYNVIIRPHPQSFVSEKNMIDNLMDKYPENKRFEWNRDNDNFNVLNKSDILISDFSGVIFDFALVFDKPIIYADVSFDKSVYDAWWLEEEMWTFRVLPKLGKQLKDDDLNSIKQVIDELIDNKELSNLRDIVRNECWANIGNSTRLIVDYLISKYITLKEGEIHEHR